MRVGRVSLSAMKSFSTSVLTPYVKALFKSGLTNVVLTLVCLLALGIFNSTIASDKDQSTDPVIPTQFNERRYEGLWRESPFDRNTSPTGNSGKRASYVLVAAADYGDEKVVTVLNRSNQELIHLSDKTTSPDGDALVSTTHDGNLDKMTASIRMKGRSMVVRYDSTATASRPAPKENTANNRRNQTTISNRNNTTNSTNKTNKPAVSRNVRKGLIRPNR